MREMFASLVHRHSLSHHFPFSIDIGHYRLSRK
jgi:hypothetical protein